VVGGPSTSLGMTEDADASDRCLSSAESLLTEGAFS
jgi:hypothetical protein